MASEFCNIPPSDDTKTILDLLPPIPSLNQVVDLINTEIRNVKVKLTIKAKDLLSDFQGICPSPSQIDRIINVRNNIVTQLTRIYNKVDRLSDNISGVSKFLTTILTVIRTVGGIANGIIIGGAIVPFPIPAAVNSAVESAQTTIEKAKFKTSGAQKLVPLTGVIISANIAVKLFASALRELICTIEALDASILECSSPISEEDPTTEEIARLEEVSARLVPISAQVIEFIEQDVASNEESDLSDPYRGFIFEIETIPFSPTVNRTRALAKNQDGITLLQSELSFTSTPDVLIQELKLVIDRDNLRAD